MNPVSLTAAALPEGLKGAAYSFDFKNLLQVSNESTSFSAIRIQEVQVASSVLETTMLIASSFLSLRRATLTRLLLAAVLAGGTSLAGAANYYLVVPNPAKAHVVEIPKEPVVVTLAEGALPEAQVAKPYSASLAGFLSVTGDPEYTGAGVTWSKGTLGALPVGLTLGADGTIFGTPTVLSPGEGESFEAVAAYKGESGQQVYTIKVGEAVLDVVQIAAGGNHTCAVTPVGGVKCWGWNNYGQLGDGTATNRSVPVDVIGLSSGVASVAAGYFHTCAVTTGGAAKCWGRGSEGQLGDGAGANSLTPTQVSGFGSGIASMSAGAYYTCAITTGAAVKCWGYNDYGQLGDGTGIDRWHPVQVSGLESGVLGLSVGLYHACAIVTDGALWCWGLNSYGQLGNGTGLDSSIPALVQGLESGVAGVSAGDAATCIVTIAGAANCWGYNGDGRLGDGTVTNRSVPTQVIGLSSGVKSVSAGQWHTCAVMTAGAVKCWGRGSEGQLGDGYVLQRPTPVDVVGLASGVASVSAGYYHTCVRTTVGTAKCWGAGDVGQVGDGAVTSRVAPVTVSPGY